jgi:hypothetical protein
MILIFDVTAMRRDGDGDGDGDAIGWRRTWFDFRASQRIEGKPCHTRTICGVKGAVTQSRPRSADLFAQQLDSIPQKGKEKKSDSER